MKFIKREINDYKMLLKNVPAISLVFFVISVILMNLLANKEMPTGVSWIALDCGFTVSWIGFLSMDMLTKRFGAKAGFKLSIIALGFNLFVCAFLFLISKIPGNWGEFYSFENDVVNQGLDNTIGGTWYVLLGSSIAFIVSASINAIINASIGKICKKNNFASYAVRSYISTLVAQFVDNMIFALIVSHVFFGWTMLQCITCSITGCIVELLCEVIFSPIGYRACKRWESEGVGEEYINHVHLSEQNESSK